MHSCSDVGNIFQVSRTTLGDRFRGTHANRKEAYTSRKLLSDSQEAAVADWMDTLAMQGLPLDGNVLRSHVCDITGKVPGHNWHNRFLKRNKDFISARASGLDPARGKNFNEPTIKDYFEKLQNLLEGTNGKIPADQIWNMDKKRIQLGGGRKDGKKKYYSKYSRKQRYKIRSDNLELVTVIECAAGCKAPSSFILKDGSAPDIRGVDDVGR